ACALALSIALALPGSASALRVSQEGTRSADLQQRLAPAAGLQPVVRPPSAEAAGLEERLGDSLLDPGAAWLDQLA
ncbi:MAG: hypothetical protein HYZ93_00125, partial [Candidatus Omnitrophica bacterium]|nr:hypothetical protein [Candidatus Omnitrophota bacterium]